MHDNEIVEAMLVAANDVLNDDDTDHVGAMQAALAVARKALTPSPADYVRPADELERLLERGVELVTMMHENDPTEPVADNGMTVWDSALVEWARWADMTSKQLIAMRRSPYVRPAADIRAEIERVETELRAIRHTERAKIEAKAHIAALTWALTPPTEEPK